MKMSIDDMSIETIKKYLEEREEREEKEATKELSFKVGDLVMIKPDADTMFGYVENQVYKITEVTPEGTYDYNTSISCRVYEDDLIPVSLYLGNSRRLETIDDIKNKFCEE